MTTADFAVSSIPSIILTSVHFCNDGIPLEPLFPSGTYIDVKLDVRTETTTLNKDSEKNMPMRRVNLDRPKLLPDNWRFDVALEPLQKFLRDSDKHKKEKSNINGDAATPSGG
ncbi:hypothetical protein H5410_052124 [Solanum commersonii]|uniref:Uncharacterized protein n=1 Tax=Solanum commersonii TaxID=4109 RepID=A0A9J5WZZ4_SOLCO|nr:hypothetical protein H5410_052124 [Solanum commersonii]